MISKGNLGDLRDSWHLPPWRHFTVPQVLHLQGMITQFFFLDKYKIYKKYLSFFFQGWILAPHGPHVLPWTRPSVRSKNLYFTSISRHICLKIITGLIKPCIFWNQSNLTSLQTRWSLGLLHSLPLVLFERKNILFTSSRGPF